MRYRSLVLLVSLIAVTCSFGVVGHSIGRAMTFLMPAQASYSLTVTPSQAAPGGQLTVTWTAPSGRPTTDWIALYKVGDPDTAYGSWIYTQGATSGIWNVTVPTQVGLYEFRYLLQNGFTVAVKSSTFPVTDFPR